MTSSAALLLFCTLLLLSLVNGETIVADSMGNTIPLPLDGGNSTGVITNTNALISISPYTLSVYINDGRNSGGSTPPVDVPGEVESFYILPPSNGTLYGDATLIKSGYSSTFSVANVVWGAMADAYLGSLSNTNTAVSLYQFIFTVPVLSAILLNLTYINTGLPEPVIDQISINVDNPAVVIGDPQFVGLHGQNC